MPEIAAAVSAPQASDDPVEEVVYTQTRKLTKVPKPYGQAFNEVVARWNLASVQHETNARSNVFNTRAMRIDRQSGDREEHGTCYGYYAIQLNGVTPSPTYAVVRLACHTEFGVQAIRQAFRVSQSSLQAVYLPPANHSALLGSCNGPIAAGNVVIMLGDHEKAMLALIDIIPTATIVQASDRTVILGCDAQGGWQGDRLEIPAEAWEAACAARGLEKDSLLLLSTCLEYRATIAQRAGELCIRLRDRGEDMVAATIVLPLGVRFAADTLQRAFRQSQVTRKPVDLAGVQSVIKNLANADGSLDAGWLAVWTKNMMVGQGFHREAGHTADVAIQFAKVEETDDDPRTYSRLKAVTQSMEFSELVSSEYSASIEGWGANAEVVSKRLNDFKTNTKTILGLVRARFSSATPIVMVNPADLDQKVELTDSAKSLLATQGPAAFHEKYGTHFIAGYTKGGYFYGVYKAEFRSETKAVQQSTTFATKFSHSGFNADAAKNTETDIKGMDGFESTTVEIFTEGWSKHVPLASTDLGGLVTAAIDSQSSSVGSTSVKRDALLARYSTIDSFNKALQQYYEQLAEPYPLFIQEETYGKLSEMVSQLHMRYAFLEDECTKGGFDDLAQQARAIMRRMEVMFHGLRWPQDMPQVRKNWLALEAFIILHAVDDELYKLGSDIYNELWKIDDLESQYKQRLPVFSIPGLAGWQFSLEDDKLVISSNGVKCFILQQNVDYNARLLHDRDTVTILSRKYGQEYRLQQSENFHTDVAAVRGWWELPRPATFMNGNRGEWERMILEKH